MKFSPVNFKHAFAYRAIDTRMRAQVTKGAFRSQNTDLKQAANFAFEFQFFERPASVEHGVRKNILLQLVKAASPGIALLCHRIGEKPDIRRVEIGLNRSGIVEREVTIGVG